MLLHPIIWCRCCVARPKYPSIAHRASVSSCRSHSTTYLPLRRRASVSPTDFPRYFARLSLAPKSITRTHHDADRRTIRENKTPLNLFTRPVYTSLLCSRLYPAGRAGQNRERALEREILPFAPASSLSLDIFSEERTALLSRC